MKIYKVNPNNNILGLTLSNEYLMKVRPGNDGLTTVRILTGRYKGQLWDFSKQNLKGYCSLVTDEKIIKMFLVSGIK